MTCDLPDENVVVESVLVSITREEVDRVINVMGYMAKQIWDLQTYKEKTMKRINENVDCYLGLEDTFQKFLFKTFRWLISSNILESKTS